MKILLATDGSGYSISATQFLSKLNITSGDEIIIVHVIHRSPLEKDTKSYFFYLKQVKHEIAHRIFELTGSVSRYILSHSECSFLTEKSDSSGNI